MDNLLPIGSYNGKIIGHDLTQLGDKKTPCVVFDVEISSGRDFEKNEVECEGTVRRVIMWLSDKAMPYTVKNVRELGYTGESLRGLALEAEETAGLVGAQVRLSVKHAEDHKGIMREKLGIYPAKTSLPKMEESALERFEKLFKKEQQKLLQEEENEGNQVDEAEDEEVVAPPKTKKIGNGFQSGAKKTVRTPF